MVEIRYGDQYEVTDLAGRTVCEAREQFKSEFGIPDKAKAKLNGSKVKTGAELDTVLNDDDKLTFAASRGKGAYLVGALLLALACTGGVFAFGFINDTVTLEATVVESNFAEVTANNSYSSVPPGWKGFGFFKGSIPAGTLFTVTPHADYTGDLAVTVSIGNGDELAKVYRVLALKLYMSYPSGSDNVVDINESSDNGTGSITSDWVMLTLDNGSVSMYPGGAADNSSVRVKRGFFITHVWPGTWTGSGSPELFCEVAQR